MNRMWILLTAGLYCGILLAVSHSFRGRGDNDAFFRGERNSPWWMVAFGMIGASISGVSFVSVPGMVQSISMTYLQTCLGFAAGYAVIAAVLLPVYYRMNLTSIYGFPGERIGQRARWTTAALFLLSKLTGAAVRLFVVCMILQDFVLRDCGVPWWGTVAMTVFAVWLWTRKGGIRSIVRTDALQTAFLLLALGILLWQSAAALELDLRETWQLIRQDPRSRIFVFDDWFGTQNFWKQFFSGILICVAMTGLDQDMMQKNLTCRTLREAQKNMCCYGLAFLPVNFCFLALGILLTVLAERHQIALPDNPDGIVPLFAAGGLLGTGSLVVFTIGIAAAACSSADSAMTALTTSICVDFFAVDRMERAAAERLRKKVHGAVAIVLTGAILLFGMGHNGSMIDALYRITAYLAGPLLGIFAFGLWSRRRVRDGIVPVIAIASPLLCGCVAGLCRIFWDYRIGYELLLLNGVFTWIGLLAASRRHYSVKSQ